MTQRDVRETGDRELEQYLAGGSKLSRRYRDASGEGAPPDLDEAILAQARAELRRKPSLNRLLTPVAIAASVLLGVNLAYNVYQSAPMPAQEVAGKRARDVFAPDPPPASEAPVGEAPAASPDAPPQLHSKARAAPPEAPAPEVRRERDAAPAAREEEKREDLAQDERAALAREQAAQSQSKMTASRNAAGAPAYAAPEPEAAPMAALADAVSLSESARIDHLINHVRTLEGAVFVRNGKAYGPAEAAKHLQYKREKAGDRVKTADDFIRLCASHSVLSGEAYLIRFQDGRTRTAEDVLREELARIGG
jgi:hypothetical protein